MPPEDQDYQAKLKATAGTKLGQTMIKQVFSAADLLVGHFGVQDHPGPCSVLITRPIGDERHGRYTITIDITADSKLH